MTGIVEWNWGYSYVNLLSPLFLSIRISVYLKYTAGFMMSGDFDGLYSYNGFLSEC